jgi:hypothetical protein
MGNYETATDAIDTANSATTNLGAVDAALKAKEATRLVDISAKAVPHGAAYKAADAAGYGLPGSGALGHVGGALAAFGFGMDIANIVENGLTGDNMTSALTNGLGAGSWMAGTAGVAGGAASTVAAPLMAAGAGGLTVGSYGNGVVEKLGWLGKSGEVDKNGEQKNRNWSDLAADWAYDADSTAGTIAGFVAGTVAGGIGAAGTAVYGAGRAVRGGVADGANALGRATGWWGNPLLAGVGGQVAAARATASEES